MAKPTLLIGIGTSGMKVLEQTQQFYYENTGRNKPGNVEYLYIETEESSEPKQTVLENQIKKIHIDLSKKETKINNLRNSSPDTWWLPPGEAVMDSGFGAGGLPAFGRVALWGGDNFRNVCGSINNAYSLIGSHAQEEADNTKPAVFLVGSLTGGTGSGIFIDMAYLIKHLLVDISEVYGLFMIPGEKELGSDPIIYCNTYAALNALDYYNKPENSYKLRWPTGEDADFQEPPFELVQFISQDYNGAVPSINTLDGLFKMAGLNLFLNIFGLRAKRLIRLGDGKANLFIGKYGTFGLSAIQYPKAQLQEYLAIFLSLDLFKRWINKTMYYQHGNKYQLEQRKAEIYNNTLVRFEEILREAFTALDSVNISSGTKIVNDLSIQARIINKKDHTEKNNFDYVHKLFTSNKIGNYYQAIKNNIHEGVDILIKRIYELINQNMDETENLHLAKIRLEAVVEAINDTIKYWISLQLSDKPNIWENKLNKQIKWMLKYRYLILGEQNHVLEDRLKTTLELMKMHLMANKIQEIRNNIVKGEYSLTSFQDKIELPTIPKIDKIIRTVKSVIASDENDKGMLRFKTLTGRQEDIETDIKDTTIPILRIFPKGNFSEEVKSSLNKYIRGSNKQIPGKETLIGKDGLWDYLNQPQEELPKILYNDAINKYEQDLSAYNSIEDLDVSQFVLGKPNEAKKIAERATYSLVRINPDKKTEFQHGKGIPKLIIAKTKGIVDDVIKKFKSMNFIQFDNNSEDDYWTNDEMNNIIIFYNEKGYMTDKSTFDPTKHLRYTNTIKRMYMEHAKKAKSLKEWHILRNPYIKWEEDKEK